MNVNFLEKKEQVALSLEGIYSRFGYGKYKMNRFEEYSFYMVNEKFLEDNRIITFYDPHGKLLALKPDITMSVIKSCLKNPEQNHKMYYNESVFRVPAGSSDFKEIHQIGAEYIGKLDSYQTMELLNLAVKSLAEISENFMLCLSNMALIVNIFEDLKLNVDQINQITTYMKQKNLHDLNRYLSEQQIAGGEIFAQLLQVNSDVTRGFAQLKALFPGKKYQAELANMATIVENLPAIMPASKVCLDFSYITNLEYYNGLIFVGYVDGVSIPVLTGGRYDKLVAKMGLEGCAALGFAVYLSAAEQILENEAPIPQTITYAPGDNVAELLKKANKLYAQGNTFSVTM
ncbi:MAG: ATP phosphoribosyltransferase regulatory subunit [Eubacteriales bacterium]